MSILYGELRPDAGEIKVRGERRVFRSPVDAIRSGLGMVHQSFMLFPSLSVVENVIYGSEPTRYGLLNWSRAIHDVQQVIDRYGLHVDPLARVGQLPVGVRQRVEILKALYRGAAILILDEPTGVLTPQEVQALFTTLRELRDQGKTILFITHKLQEVMGLCDNATVLRDGKVTATQRVAETSPQEISRAMTGRDVLLNVTKAAMEPGKSILDVDQLCVLNESNRPLVSDATFHVRAGEIVGIAGVAGNGQTELIEALVGLRTVDGGQVTLGTTDVTRSSVGDRRSAGLAYVPEDRGRMGAALGATVAQNLAMGYQSCQPISRHGVLNLKGMNTFAQQFINRFAIKVSGPNSPASSLSGGNLQKVTLARELGHSAPCLIVEQPTRGLDIGAIEFVHRQILDYRDKGNAVLIVSAELSEIMALSDRILVMLEGQIVGEVSGAEATEATLGMMMTGVHETVTPRAVTDGSTV